jgi:hypothetical protein
VNDPKIDPDADQPDFLDTGDDAPDDAEPVEDPDPSPKNDTPEE